MNEIFFGTLLLLVIGVLIYYFTRRPSNKRDWEKDVAILSNVTFHNDSVTLTSIRDIAYKTSTDYELRRDTKKFEISDVESVWFSIAQFWPQLGGIGLAHTFISFGLKDGSYISISPEMRRLRGELFSFTTAIKVLLRQREMVYVVAYERDVLALRTRHWKDDVYLYPLKLEKSQKESLLKDMLLRVGKLHNKPEFFHLLLHNCASTTMNHLRSVIPALPRMHIKYAFPATIDSILFSLGLIDSPLSYNDARKHFHVTRDAQKIKDMEKFSKLVRENLSSDIK
ncbi:MAG: DUF4105 domain-containing protein [Candidatus Pacebacteria bacterium]|nr:DUF4105 domain-containing protein [Candidatus Paceibacterota bacterium]